MRSEEISADTVDEAAEQILKVLEKTDTTRTVSSRDNVFYFDGWDGLGASAVLRAIAQRLATTSADGKRALAELEFDQLIHIDCSMWESRRAVQKAVAEQLKLRSEVMELFDREDEEDDFRGVAQGSRAEVQQVVKEMHQHIKKLDNKFLVVFHNGSNKEIDLASLCGFPLSGYSTSKVLWTFQGRFQLKPRTKVDTAMKTAGTTDVFLLAYPRNKIREELWPYLVLQEAEEVVAACNIVNTVPGNIIHQSEEVADCFQYMLEVGFRGRHLTDYDLVTHSANYWMCDGIIQQRQEHDEDIIGLWRAADALHHEIRLDMDYHQYVPSSQLIGSWQIQSKPYWTSPTHGFILIPTKAMLNEDMFQHSADKLSVLKLSGCTFDFRSPPFLCCHSLRFLWLDHCQGIMTSTEVAGKEEDIRQCFQRLWVLDVRHTDCDQILSAQMLAFMTQLRELNVIGSNGWDMGQLQGRLPNIRKFRVKNSSVICNCPENDLFTGMNKMEHLDFSRNNSTVPILFGPGVISNVSCLETVVIAGECDSQQISFCGCTKLKNLLFGGSIRVHTVDISGTAVKTLDLSGTRIPNLDELYLLDCENLCAILWPPKHQMKQAGLGKLCIDTTQSAPTAQSREEKAKRGTSTATTGMLVAPAATLHGSGPSCEFDWHISVRDARLLASLVPVYSDSYKAYVEVSSPGLTIVASGSKDDKGIKSRCSSEQQVLVYAETTVDHLKQASEGNCDDALGMWTWPCPDVPDLPRKSCYLHLQDHQMGTKLLSGSEEIGTITVPEFVIDCAKILHVHDSLSMTIFPSCTKKYVGSEWHMLDWCRIERCPKLDCVFTSRETTWWISFSYRLRTFWASQLLKARFIWEKSEPSNYYRTFPYLTFLHLSCCPRLIYVLPLSYETFKPNSFTLKFGHSLRQLQTLEITWCGDLREVFPLDSRAKNYVEQQSHPVTLNLPSLKYICLLELPRLQCIFGVRMSAPNLESVKIRGCWSLTRLPDVSTSSKIVECDCEKEWWDRLEWDDVSQVEHYKPIHSQYYMKTMLRGTVLR